MIMHNAHFQVLIHTFQERGLPEILVPPYLVVPHCLIQLQPLQLNVVSQHENLDGRLRIIEVNALSKYMVTSVRKMLIILIRTVVSLWISATISNFSLPIQQRQKRKTSRRGFLARQDLKQVQKLQSYAQLRQEDATVVLMIWRSCKYPSQSDFRGFSLGEPIQKSKELGLYSCPSRFSLTLEDILLAMLALCQMRILFCGCGLKSMYMDFLQFYRNSRLLNVGSSFLLNYMACLQFTSTFETFRGLLNFSQIYSNSPIFPLSMLFKLSHIFQTNSTFSFSITRISLTFSLASSSIRLMTSNFQFISFLREPKNLKPFQLSFCMYFSRRSQLSNYVAIYSIRQKLSYFIDQISFCLSRISDSFWLMRAQWPYSSFWAKSMTCFWLAMNDSLQASREYRQLCYCLCMLASTSFISSCNSSLTFPNTLAQISSSRCIFPSSSRQIQIAFLLPSTSAASYPSVLTYPAMPLIFLLYNSTRC